MHLISETYTQLRSYIYNVSAKLLAIIFFISDKKQDVGDKYLP